MTDYNYQGVYWKINFDRAYVPHLMEAVLINVSKLFENYTKTKLNMVRILIALYMSGYQFKMINAFTAWLFLNFWLYSIRSCFCRHACNTSKHVKHCHFRKSWLSHIFRATSFFSFSSLMEFFRISHNASRLGQYQGTSTQLRGILDTEPILRMCP